MYDCPPANYASVQHPNAISTIYLRSIPLQKITAANVLTSVASTAGPTTAAGLALPYWLR